MQQIAGKQEHWAQRDGRTTATEERCVQWNSGYRGTVDTVEQWVQRNSGYRGTVDTEEQWVQRNRLSKICIPVP